MTIAALGTAHLFGAVADDRSAGLLDAALGAGFRAFDTAPLYGHGRSEVTLGERVAAWPGSVHVTSKVGLEPDLPDSPGRRWAKSAARRLPGAVRRRLRAGDGVPRGTFDPDGIRWSLDRTLLRLGHVDRLMLHEAHAEDLTDEILAVLEGFRVRGDVGQIGVGTVNAAAADVVRRAPDLITAAHLDVGPFAAPADLPSSVTTVVGHGALGAGASGLRRLVASAAQDDESSFRWREVTDGTRWAGPAGLADALVARAAALPVSGVIVATSRPERLPGLYELASGSAPAPHEIAAALDALIGAARTADRVEVRR